MDYEYLIESFKGSENEGLTEETQFNEQADEIKKLIIRYYIRRIQFAEDSHSKIVNFNIQVSLLEIMKRIFLSWQTRQWP